MSQQRTAAANQARAEAKAQQMGAIGGLAGVGMQVATSGMSGMGGGSGAADLAKYGGGGLTDSGQYIGYGEIEPAVSTYNP